MADNNTFVLFEEIKNKLETIYRELKELKEKENSSASFPVPSTSVQHDDQQEQEWLNQYEQRIKEVINKYIGVQVRIKDEEAKSIDKLVASVFGYVTRVAGAERTSTTSRTDSQTPF